MIKQKVLAILFESFCDNKSVDFLVKQGQKKESRIKILLEYSYFMGENFGEIILTDDEKGCAILIDPSKKKTTLKSIGWDLKLMVKSIGLFRVIKILKRESLLKKNYPKTPFIHLWYIGIETNNQGKGIGTKLMEEIIYKYHNLGLSICLETSTPRNFKFYENLGFEEIVEINDIGYSLKMYLKSK
jgi:ribosomal protein S18 acetylase RimI-like enzyme